MQSKGAIRFLAIAFALVCLFQLSFTYCTRTVESDAVEYAQSFDLEKMADSLAKGDAARAKIIQDSLQGGLEQHFLDSMSNEVVYNFLWMRKYTYRDCKQKEINLGLDLKGGMNVTLEISLPDIIRSLANNSTDPAFETALAKAKKMQESSDKDFLQLFEQAWNENDPNRNRLASIFVIGLKDQISFNSTNTEVMIKVREEAEGAIDRTFNILRTRIDRFGVTQPNIQKLSTTGRILIELPGIKEPERVRNLLKGTAKLEFWETYEYENIYSFMEMADKKAVIGGSTTDTVEKDSTATAKADSLKADSLKNIAIKADSGKTDSLAAAAGKPDSGNEEQDSTKFALEHPLFAYLQPALTQNEDGQYFPNKGPVCGYCRVYDTARVGEIMRRPEIKAVFPADARFAWTVKPVGDKGIFLQLIALKASADGTASLNGDVIVDARQDFGQNNGNEVSMSMNSEGAQIWKNLTANNIGKSIAIVLDDYVYSFPTVQGEIPNGRSSISGATITLEEAKDLANILKAGKMPAPTRIVEEAVVGPSLGAEAISAGLWSFLIAIIFVLTYMILYYNRGGLVANLALMVNVFFLMGTLASLGAVLTLPGIAGIVLTLGMAVDANVIIFERVKEEIRAGKGGRLALTDGYKHAYSAIIDSNVTTLIAGIVLYVFGSGPVQGFATTLIIGILSTLFTAIFVSRLIFEAMLNRNWKINYWNGVTKNFFTNVQVNWTGIRKKLYIFSAIIIVAGITSIIVRGFSQGVDFAGGRTYVVRFDQDVKATQIRLALRQTFGEDLEVKTFGDANQVKITTKYLVNDDGPTVDSIIESKLYDGLKSFYTSDIEREDFVSSKQGKEIGKLSSQKVGPTIADDIRIASIWAVSIALVLIFVYVAIRFKKWQWGLGALAALIHDSLIILSLYSLLYGIAPWSMEIDQTTIAVLLTIIGFSVNDTVIIFDRIREYRALYPKRELHLNIDQAINSTLGRTVNTSGTVAVALLAMLLFGGEIIRGMNFALLIGIIIGTYSSIGIATPLAYDLITVFTKKSKKRSAGVGADKL